MGRNDILQVPGNAENLGKLMAQKKSLVPFIGAGFSMPACPTWSAFLENFFQKLKKDEFLLAKEQKEYLGLKKNTGSNQYERMADLLVEKAQRGKFEEEIKEQFNLPMLPGMKRKFGLLHQAFPGLKITTNFDCLIEDNASASGTNVKVCYGYQPEELQRLFTHIQQNALLKIHGGLRDIPSIVLSSSQYEKMYGDPESFNPEAQLPAFLKRVFTNRSVLFIGCSLLVDRTTMIMKQLRDMHLHFAVMKWLEHKEERVLLKRRLSGLRIYPIWVTDFQQIGEILQRLLDRPIVQPVKPPLDHGVPFVGRAAELEQIRENLEQEGSSGSIQMITGRLFSIEGAGGVGKTTLAIEAAKRYKAAFKNGVLNPIRVDEHTPISFAMHLAALLHERVDEPPDEISARDLVIHLLKDRQCLLILDNAVDWNNLQYMLPIRTSSTLLVTTRNRDMYRHLRLKCKQLRVHEIPLEKFTPEEALALFKEMLEAEYRDMEEDIYLEIAHNLGYLPIALRQAISLMVFIPHYPASVLRDKLAGENRLALLRKGQAAEDSDSRVIETVFDLSSPLLTGELIETLEYLAVCSPGPVPLAFLRQLTKNEDTAERLEQLYTFPWCERRESYGQRAYELHQLVRELVRGRFQNRFQESFIQLVHDIFTNETIHFSIKEKFYLQLGEALLAASANGDKRLIDLMYSHDLYYFCTYRGFADFYIRLTQSVETLFPGDRRALRGVYTHRALIYESQGKLEEAMALHKKEEKIYEELGDRAGLAVCRWNQGLIYNKKRNYKKQSQLWQKSIQINKELGIPTTEDEKALAELLKEKIKKA